MKMKATLGGLLALALIPGIGSATMILDTGTPAGTGLPVRLDATDWYAAKFSVAAGQTITQLSAYLTQGLGAVGNTFTWDIYSDSGAFLNATSSTREKPSFTATGTFGGNGWNTTDVNWTPSAPGLYWVALQVGSKTQTPGLNLPLESSTATGTSPAQAFAYLGTTGRYAVETNAPIGLQVNAVPLPAAVWLLGSGLLGLASMRRRRV